MLVRNPPAQQIVVADDNVPHLVADRVNGVDHDAIGTVYKLPDSTSRPRIVDGVSAEHKNLGLLQSVVGEQKSNKGYQRKLQPAQPPPYGVRRELQDCVCPAEALTTTARNELLELLSPVALTHLKVAVERRDIGTIKTDAW